jgi:hypothetical protein
MGKELADKNVLNFHSRCPGPLSNSGPILDRFWTDSQPLLPASQPSTLEPSEIPILSIGLSLRHASLRASQAAGRSWMATPLFDIQCLHDRLRPFKAFQGCSKIFKGIQGSFLRMPAERCLMPEYPVLSFIFIEAERPGSLTRR